jgi:hypothetical protein
VPVSQLLITGSLQDATQRALSTLDNSLDDNFGNTISNREVRLLQADAQTILSQAPYSEMTGGKWTILSKPRVNRLRDPILATVRYSAASETAGVSNRFNLTFTAAEKKNYLGLAPANAQTMYASEHTTRSGAESPSTAGCEGCEDRDGELDDFVDLGLGIPPELKVGSLYPEQESAIDYALKHTQMNMGAHEQLTYVGSSARPPETAFQQFESGSGEVWIDDGLPVQTVAGDVPR